MLSITVSIRDLLFLYAMSTTRMILLVDLFLPSVLNIIFILLFCFMVGLWINAVLLDDRFFRNHINTLVNGLLVNFVCLALTLLELCLLTRVFIGLFGSVCVFCQPSDFLNDMVDDWAQSYSTTTNTTTREL